MELIIVLGFLTALTVLAEFIITFWKRTRLILKLATACRKGGYKLKFKRFPYFSVLFFRGRLDLLIESDLKKFAVVIITSRHRGGKFVFHEGHMEIWRQKKYLFAAGGRRPTVFQGEMKFKGKINLRLNKIISKYPIHEGICLINPVPREVSISYGTAHTQIFDGDRLHSGFKVYGLSGFSRLIASSGDEKSSF